MREELIKLVRIRMDKAEKTAKDAGILLGSGSYFGSVNRSYYAAFYAARALLATKEMDSPKHSGVISLFNQHFVKEGVVSKELGKMLNELFEIRSEGDYEDERLFTKEEAEKVLVICKTFLAGIGQTIGTKELKNEEEEKYNG